MVLLFFVYFGLGFKQLDGRRCFYFFGFFDLLFLFICSLLILIRLREEGKELNFAIGVAVDGLLFVIWLILIFTLLPNDQRNSLWYMPLLGMFFIPSFSFTFSNSFLPSHFFTFSHFLSSLLLPNVRGLMILGN